MNTRPADNPARPATYYFYNLGCPKNLVDAERTANALDEAGWTMAGDPAKAGLIVVTTCAFIEAAEEESIELILEIASARKQWQILAVLGCLVSREGDRLGDLIPEVDVFLDVESMTSLAALLKGEGAQPRPNGEAAPAGRKLFTPAGTAYLKISEGCSNMCSYCTIPSIRGPLRSCREPSLLEEAGRLAGSGVREIVVIAQDTTAWGGDAAGAGDLYRFLERLSGIDGIEWIRLMYLHPARVDADRLAEIIRSTKVVPYLDIPIQHVSDTVLERMGRGYSGRDLRELFGRLRSAIDGLVLRTTLMTGFPGETEDDFRELLSFVEQQRFEHAGIFRWSPERGTRAARLGGHVPEGQVSERLEELSALQFDISEDILAQMVGRSIEVLVESKGVGEPELGPWGGPCGRWYGQAPEIDGVTWLEDNVVAPGGFVTATVERSEAYDLFAAPRGDFV